MSRGVWILGASGHAKVVISTLRAAGQEVLGCYDDDAALVGGHCGGIPVLGRIQDLDRLPGLTLIAVGSSRARLALAFRFPEAAWGLAVHPFSWIAPGTVLGPGSVVFAGAVIQPDSVIGSHCILNTGCSVDHDCRLGDGVHLAPGVRLAGGVTVEAGVTLGIGSVVIPGLRIGAGTVVGAGSTVTADLPPGITAVGSPARPLPGR